MNKEIEIKIRVAEFETFQNKLKELGCVFTNPVLQDDMVFINYEGEYTLFPEGANYLRIRQTKDKSFFTLKRGEEMDSIEREVEISDPIQMRDAILYMGYKEAVRVKKVRTKTNFKGYEICFDSVEGLGNFVEVEKITDEDTEKVRKEMLEFLEGFGLDTKERVHNGYDTLMYLKKK
ncbi:MAG: class IV adenylate cyclase [Candidatus Pacebacteria bacterium]|nr:class IV adenylate cyclase [Candidatus Paceibacterota bacterium]MBP9818626.1 class IV adenylate cyclase [Candidatus Paceibacterota bacterium]